jgi:hypothetical protein
MIMDIFVGLFSLVCSFIWARYAIRTILTERTASGGAAHLAEGANLEFPNVRESLDSPPERNEYRRFAESLRYDFLVVGYHMRSTPTGGMLPYSLKEKALVLDFRLMQFLCAIGQFVWPPMARFALREMIAVLICFAGIADQRMFAEASEWF